uniref:Uncharacterized protein n=1 Tax=Bacillus thuringiensis serovar chinensis CT-43 TaxID=541229 RepID=E7CGS3_BACTU|nr:hypothetical protein pBMB0558_00750 [Bacillus thuringiensis serovar chinensis CT-43]
MIEIAIAHFVSNNAEKILEVMTFALMPAREAEQTI